MQEELTRGVVEEIGAADDVGDALSGIVDDDGELVGEIAVGAEEDEVACVAGDVLSEGAAGAVVEGDGAGRDEKAPGAGQAAGWEAGAAGAGIGTVAGSFAGAGAGVDEAVSNEAIEGVAIEVFAAALEDDLFVGVEAEAGEGAEDGGGPLGAAAGLVDIFEADEPGAGVGAGVEPGGDGGDEGSHVQRPGGRGRESAAIHSIPLSPIAGGAPGGGVTAEYD